MNIEKVLEQAFDLNGNCKGLNDPYREYPKNEVQNAIFDEDGDVNYDAYSWIFKFVRENKNTIEPLCDAVKVIIASDFSGNTKGNYSAIYLWR